MVSRSRLLWTLPLALALVACGPKPPVARPGDARNIAVGTRVVLDGTASSDERGSALLFTWALTGVPDGSQALLQDPDRGVASFVPDRAGEYTVSLMVATDELRSAPATVTLTATAEAPTAHLASQSAIPGQVVVLDGSSSSAPSGGPLAFEWTVADPAGESVQLTAATTARPSFRPVKVGTYAVALVVSDGARTSSPAQASVVVAEALRPPVAVVSPASTDAALGAPVRLDGYGSHDPDGTAVGWAWTLLHKPASSAATLSAAADSVTTFTPDVAGDYVVSLVVTDASGEPSVPALARVRVVNGAPRIVFPAPGTGWVETPLQLDASASVDPDGDAVDIEFRLATMLPGQASLSPGPLPGMAQLTAWQPGTYGVEVTVTDALGHVVREARAVTVHQADALVVISGANQSAAPRTALAQPVTVEARHGATPVPNARVSFRAHNGAIVSAQGRTDAQGRAVAYVETGRLAGAGKAWAQLDAVPSAAAAEAPFITLAGPVELLVLSAPRRWMSTGGTLVSVRTTDAFGNPASNAATASTPIRLKLDAITASFDTAVQGTAGLLESGGGSFEVTGKLVDGRFDILVKDLKPGAFAVTLEAIPGTTTTPLTLAHWWVAGQDDAEGGFVSGWSQLGAWPWKPLVAPQVAGKRAYVAAVPPGFALSQGEARLVLQLPAYGNSEVARGRYVERLDRASAVDPSSGCSARPSARLLQSSCTSGCPQRELEPVEVALDRAGCDGRRSLPPTGSGLAQRTVDLTDGLSAGMTQVHFALESTPNAFTPVQPATWSMDDLLVEYLRLSAGTTTTLQTGIIPGPATRVAFTQPDFGNVVYVDGICINGRPASLTVPVRLLDEAGMPGRTAEPVQLRFEVGQGLEAAVAPGTTAVGIPGTKQVDVEVGAQNPYVNVHRPAVVVSSPVDVDSSITVSELSSSGLQVPLQVPVSFKPLTCHNNGSGKYWADTRPQNTWDATQAIRACEVEYGVGQCVASADHAMTLTNVGSSSGCAGQVRYYSRAWYFASKNGLGSCNAGTVNMGPGDIATALALDTPVQGKCDCNSMRPIEAPVTADTPTITLSKAVVTWN